MVALAANTSPMHAASTLAASAECAAAVKHRRVEMVAVHHRSPQTCAVVDVGGVSVFLVLVC